MRRARLLICLVLLAASVPGGGRSQPAEFRAGAAAVTITGAGSHPDWPGWVNPVTGVWGEEFVDLNGNRRWDWDPSRGGPEPFVDDPRNTALDPGAAGTWQGIWVSGFGGDRQATGVHDQQWARALVLERGDTRVALVALDVVGFFYDDVERVRRMLSPALGIDTLVVASTHNHQSPDTLGLWGIVFLLDGKFPMYMEFIRRRIVEAVEGAVADLRPAAARFVEAPTPRELVVDFRDPLVHDDVIRAMQFASVADGTTIATAVVYSSHAESVGGSNTLLSSDYPHYLRVELERRLGGTALFFAGSVGGILGPLTNIGEVDGKGGWTPGHEIPLYDANCVAVPGAKTTPDTFEKARSVGCPVAIAAAEALATAPWVVPAALAVREREFYVPNDNWVLRSLNGIGLFDRLTYTAGGLPAGPTVVGDYFKTQMVWIDLGGAAEILTVPGELFPELANGGLGRPSCAAADTGAPREPALRDHMKTAPLTYVIGLGNDEVGYIVPKYDFYLSGTPTNEVRVINYLNVEPDENRFGYGAPDPCSRPGDRHYEETVSGSSVLAPLVACVGVELATGTSPWGDPRFPACTRENTRGRPAGLLVATPLDDAVDDLWRPSGGP